VRQRGLKTRCATGLRLRAGQKSALFCFPVRVVFAAMRAKLLHFKTLGCRLFVLGARVVPVLAFLTLERDDFSWHFSLLLNPESR
jgi:hypothetical protein